MSQRKRDVQFVLLNCKQVTLETGLHQVLIANTSIYCNYKTNTVNKHIVAGLANFPRQLKFCSFIVCCNVLPRITTSLSVCYSNFVKRPLHT